MNQYKGIRIAWNAENLIFNEQHFDLAEFTELRKTWKLALQRTKLFTIKDKNTITQERSKLIEELNKEIMESEIIVNRMKRNLSELKCGEPQMNRIGSFL